MIEAEDVIERYFPYINPVLAPILGGRNADSLGFDPGTECHRVLALYGIT